FAELAGFALVGAQAARHHLELTHRLAPGRILLLQVGDDPADQRQGPLRLLEREELHPHTISSPGICSAWLMKPITRRSSSTTVMVGRRWDAFGSRSRRSV